MSTNWRARYEAYIQSSKWQATKKAALHRAQSCCQSPLCSLAYLRSLQPWERAREVDEWLPPNAYRLEVHHLTYERLGREHPDDLIVLCPRCHDDQHSGRSPMELAIEWHNSDKRPPRNETIKPFTTSMQDALVQALVRMTQAFRDAPE